MIGLTDNTPFVNFAGGVLIEAAEIITEIFNILRDGVFNDVIPFYLIPVFGVVILIGVVKIFL